MSGRLMDTVTGGPTDMSAAGIVAGMDYTAPADGWYHSVVEFTGLPSAGTAIAGSHIRTTSGDVRIEERGNSTGNRTSGNGTTTGSLITGQNGPMYLLSGEKFRHYFSAITSGTTVSWTRRIFRADLPTSNAIDATAIASAAFARAKFGDLTELAAIPAAAPNLFDAVALLYQALRNASTQTAAAQTIKNDAGTTIGTAVCSDDGTTFTRGEFA